LRESLTDILVVVIAAIAFVALFRVGNDMDDPAWEERWRELSPAERARFARAARTGSLLASQEEIELAAGFARRDLRRRAPFTMSYVARVAIGLAFLAAGLIADSILLPVAAAFFLGGGLWALSTDSRVARAERETITRDHSF